MIFVKNFICTPNLLKQGVVTIVLLKFEAQNKNNEVSRPVQITYTIPDAANAAWKGSPVGKIDPSGKNLIINESFSAVINGYKHKVEIGIGEMAPGDGFIIDMNTIDLTDNDDDLDSAKVTTI